jgi:S-formylglutathione hydrolase FrmB
VQRSRIRRLRRQGLNPVKIVFVYFMTFLLVSWHQSGRLAEWFEDLALSTEGRLSEAALNISRNLHEKIEPYGPAQLNHLEDRFLRLFTGGEIGAVRAREPEQSQEPEPIPPITRIKEPPKPEPAPPPQQFEPKPEPEITGSVSLDIPLTQKPEPEPPPSPEIFNPARVLLLGDSMMLEGLGPQLQRELSQKYPHLTVDRDGRYGTGLTRLDYFDWLGYFEAMLVKYTPDLVILTVGANDPQDILTPDNPKRKRIIFGTDEWNSIYTARAADLLTRAMNKGATVFWVGLPVMGRQPYGRRIEGVNMAAEAACVAAPNCRFWDSRLSVADAKGAYITFQTTSQGRRERLRAKDFIHLTETGGRIMAEKFLQETADWVDYQPRSSMEPAPAAATVPAGVWSEYHFYSPALKRETVGAIAAPAASLNQTRTWPVIFLLHGAWDNYQAWAEQLSPVALAALAERFQVIIIMPDAEPFGWYLDGPESAIETYLTNELIPKLPEISPYADPGRVYAAGLSMGGHGALTLAIKHPNIFKGAAALSAITDLAAHFGAHPLDPELKIDQILGQAGPAGANWRAYGARGLFEANPTAWGHRPLWLGVGTDDQLTFEENRAFHELLNTLHIGHIYQEKPGGHNWGYWSAELPGLLEFLATAAQETPEK